MQTRVDIIPTFQVCYAMHYFVTRLIVIIVLQEEHLSSSATQQNLSSLFKGQSKIISLADIKNNRNKN